MTRNSMTRDCWITTANPYDKYDSFKSWWKTIEEEEKNKMRFTNAQLRQINDTISAFAKRNGLSAETAYDTCNNDCVHITFNKGRIGKTYYIHAVLDMDVRKQLDSVFADVTRYWKLDENPIKPSVAYPGIKKVIFSNPCTIVLWDDGTKTVVRCTNEEFDPEKGLAMAIAKKTLGNNGNYFEVFKKWINKEEHND